MTSIQICNRILCGTEVVPNSYVTYITVLSLLNRIASECSCTDTVIHQKHKDCNRQVHNFTTVLYECEIRAFIQREYMTTTLRWSVARSY
jgi:hypothetical protein